jgi:triosephosphate isomerase
MKKLFLVANWKSHKTVTDAHTFMINFLNKGFIEWMHKEDADSAKKVIICPPMLLLSELAKLLEHTELKVPIFLGAQDVSVFAEGAHTGEVAASELKGLVSYVIVGHSERRQEFAETDEVVAKKVSEAKRQGLEPIVCVQSKSTPVPEHVRIVAYEPVEAIGTGHPDTPEDAEDVAVSFKEQGISYVLYGGSVTPENVYDFTSLEHIDGVLVGGASLDPLSFAHIIQRA